MTLPKSLCGFLFSDIPLQTMQPAVCARYWLGEEMVMNVAINRFPAVDMTGKIYGVCLF